MDTVGFTLRLKNTMLLLGRLKEVQEYVSPSTGEVCYRGRYKRMNIRVRGSLCKIEGSLAKLAAGPAAINVSASAVREAAKTLATDLGIDIRTSVVKRMDAPLDIWLSGNVADYLSMIGILRWKRKHWFAPAGVHVPNTLIFESRRESLRMYDKRAELAKKSNWDLVIRPASETRGNLLRVELSLQSGGVRDHLKSGLSLDAALSEENYDRIYRRLYTTFTSVKFYREPKVRIKEIGTQKRYIEAMRENLKPEAIPILIDSINQSNASASTKARYRNELIRDRSAEGPDLVNELQISLLEQLQANNYLMERG